MNVLIKRLAIGGVLYAVTEASFLMGKVSGWSVIKSLNLGKAPGAPTTWSSTTTATVGESVQLYWVHNSEDNSSQTYAQLETTINGTTKTETIKNTKTGDNIDDTSYKSLSTTAYTEGTTILWRVRTAGVTGTYGAWSVQRTIDVYAVPTVQLNVTDSLSNPSCMEPSWA